MCLDATSDKKDGFLESKNRSFTYLEILKITRNFERVLGKGGFGTVYHGCLGDIQVAIKVLSQSSVQGYREFETEVRKEKKIYLLQKLNCTPFFFSFPFNIRVYCIFTLFFFF